MDIKTRPTLDPFPLFSLLDSKSFSLENCSALIKIWSIQISLRPHPLPPSTKEQHKLPPFTNYGMMEIKRHQRKNIYYKKKSKQKQNIN